MAAEDAKRLEGRIPESAAPGRRVLLLRRPVGVLGLITPWNWPYTMPAEVLAPALACGCTVVWMPASSTAVCSGVLAECVAEADIPPGAFNFVLGPGSDGYHEDHVHVDLADRRSGYRVCQWDVRDKDEKPAPGPDAVQIPLPRPRPFARS